MARKIYTTINNITSFSLGLVIPATDNKKVEKKHVYFNGGVTHPKFIPATHTEEEEKWQKALEASPFYGKKYKLVATLKDVEKPVVKQPPVTEPKRPPVQEVSPVRKIHQVKTLQGAIENLIKNGYDGDVDELTDLDSIVTAAKTLNIEYTKLTE
jgi:hypothetical protein